MTGSPKIWPINTDFTKAIQRPDLYLADSDLNKCQPKINSRLKRPMSWSGNFAVVYQLSKSNSSWAVKCFTSPPEMDAENRYTAISNHLSNQQLPWLVGFHYQTQEILIRSYYYPIVKMEWVEGKKIDRYISNNINNKTLLQNLFLQLEQLQQELRLIKIAHGDLQHGNILVTQSGKIKLVDYDGMYVPALRNSPPKNETGHSNYRHPNRSPKDYNEQLDDFSFDVIMLSLAATIRKPNLWNQFHTDNENFLFRKADFEKPDQSSVFSSVAQINDPDVQFLLQRLICRCKNLPLPTAPTINPQPSVVPPGNVIVPPTPGGSGVTPISPQYWPIWLTRLLVQVNKQLLILGIVSLLVLGVYLVVNLWNTQEKLSPIQTVKKFYETAPSNQNAALELTSKNFQNLATPDLKFWSSVEKVELFNTQILGRSENNVSVKLLVKYLMKDGTTKCEPTIIELVFDTTQKDWLINHNVKLLDSCPQNFQ